MEFDSRGTLSLRGGGRRERNQQAREKKVMGRADRYAAAGILGYSLREKEGLKER